MPPAADAILFDLDGTLLDSLSSIALSMNEALASIALPTHETKAYRRFVGDGVRVLAERVLPPSERHRVDELLDAYRPRYRARQLEAPAYDGVQAMLDALAARKIPMAVLTNKPDDLAVEIVGALFAAIPFAHVRGERPSVPKKPDPTQALELARRMGARPERCWFVGDTPTDVQTAKNAGMTAVAVLWGFRPKEELEAAGAARFASSPEALVSMLFEGVSR
jgi:phosphoglycolate phosphatase